MSSLREMKKYIALSFTIILAITTILLFWAFFSRLAMPFNSEGNYFDSNECVVYHQYAVEVYGLLSILFLFFTIMVIFILKKLYPKDLAD